MRLARRLTHLVVGPGWGAVAQKGPSFVGGGCVSARLAVSEDKTETFQDAPQ